MAQVFEKRLNYVGNDVDLWELSKIYGKWLKYLTNGLNMWELTWRFWEMAKMFMKWFKYTIQNKLRTRFENALTF